MFVNSFSIIILSTRTKRIEVDQKMLIVASLLTVCSLSLLVGIYVGSQKSKNFSAFKFYHKVIDTSTQDKVSH